MVASVEVALNTSGSGGTVAEGGDRDGLILNIRGSVSLRNLPGMPGTAGQQSAYQVELSCLAACSAVQQFEPIRALFGCL